MLQSKKKYGLAIDTSGRVGSVTIGQEDSVLLESSFSGFMRHSAELFDTLNTLIERVGIHPDQIDPLYITAGPGSFTGIRIAVTFAKMLSYAVGSRVVAVNTLDALVENANDYLDQTQVDIPRMAAILDAKQNRFFTAIYEKTDDGWKKIYPDSLLSPRDFLSLINKDKVRTGLLGEGLLYYADRFDSPSTHVIDPAFWPVSARKVYSVGCRMAQQGLFSDIYALGPSYIRKPDAVEKQEKLNRL